MNRGIGGWDGHQAPEFGVWGRSTKTGSGSDRTKPVCNPRNDRKGWDLGLDQLQGGRDPQQDPEEAVQSSGVALSRHL